MKEKEERFISVFKGSAVEADQVHDYLRQNNLGSLVRNHLQENLSAAWVGPEADFAAEVFVSEEDRILAEKYVANMFHDGLSKPPLVETAHRKIINTGEGKNKTAT